MTLQVAVQDYGVISPSIQMPSESGHAVLQAIRAAIILMSALVHEYMDTLAETATEALSRPGPELAVARLEGIGLCFLCSPDVSIRRAAWDFLIAVRQLHSALSAMDTEGQLLSCMCLLRNECSIKL